MNIFSTPPPAARPLYRAGNHAALLIAITAPAPGPASIIDAAYMGPDSPGGVTPAFAKAVAEAKTKPMGSPDREAAYKAISKMAHDDPQHIIVCWSPLMVVARKGVVGIEKEAYLDAAAIPDIRTYGMVKN